MIFRYPLLKPHVAEQTVRLVIASAHCKSLPLAQQQSITYHPKIEEFFSNLLEQIPAKLHDFADKDLLQHIDLARFLFGKVIPPERKAR
jgi:hypothetical protein